MSSNFREVSRGSVLAVCLQVNCDQADFLGWNFASNLFCNCLEIIAEDVRVEGCDLMCALRMGIVTAAAALVASLLLGCIICNYRIYLSALEP
jgi:hypothetical protein